MSNNPVGGKQFVQVLGEIRGGLLQLSATQQLADVVKACQYAGKSGEIVLKIKIEPHGRDNAEMHLSGTITTKKPADPNVGEKSVFFATHDGDLVREDPNQQQLGLRSVERMQEDGGDRAINRFGS